MKTTRTKVVVTRTTIIAITTIVITITFVVGDNFTTFRATGIGFAPTITTQFVTIGRLHTISLTIDIRTVLTSKVKPIMASIAQRLTIGTIGSTTKTDEFTITLRTGKVVKIVTILANCTIVASVIMRFRAAIATTATIPVNYRR
jgi:hypothetical protein